MSEWRRQYRRIGVSPLERLKYQIIRLYWTWFKGRIFTPLPIHIRERMIPGEWHCIERHIENSNTRWWLDGVEVTNI